MLSDGLAERARSFYIASSSTVRRSGAFTAHPRCALINTFAAAGEGDAQGVQRDNACAMQAEKVFCELNLAVLIRGGRALWCVPQDVRAKRRLRDISHCRWLAAAKEITRHDQAIEWPFGGMQRADSSKQSSKVTIHIARNEDFCRHLWLLCWLRLYVSGAGQRAHLFTSPACARRGAAAVPWRWYQILVVARVATPISLH